MLSKLITKLTIFIRTNIAFHRKCISYSYFWDIISVRTEYLILQQLKRALVLFSVCPQDWRLCVFGRKECTLVINVVSEWGSGWILSFLVFVASFLMF